MPKHVFKRWAVQISPSGELTVKSGDTISGYCAAIYRKLPSQTKSHWSEFSRSRGGRPLADANRIRVGDTLWRAPYVKSAESRGSAGNSKDAVAAAKIVEKLQTIKRNGLETFDEMEKLLKRTGKKMSKTVLAGDMAGAVLTAPVGGYLKVAKLAKSTKVSAKVADDISWTMIKQVFGFSANPFKRGVVQNVGTTIGTSQTDALESEAEDSPAVAGAKTVLDTFLNITSPGWLARKWMKYVGDGDPIELNRKLLLENAADRRKFIERMDVAIGDARKELESVQNTPDATKSPETK